LGSFSGSDEVMVTDEYYEEAWKREGVNTWRVYPGCFNRISWFVGSGKKVLDIGCGVGVLLEKLKANGNKCTGIDISQTAVEIVRNKGIDAFYWNVPPLKFVKNKFDFVIATEFFEHIEDDLFLLEECARVCKKGGWIIVGVPNNVLGPEQEKEHVRKYDMLSLCKLLSNVSDDFYVEAFDDEFTSPRLSNPICLPTLLGRVKVVK
jgi:2-polyprenyl-3-methyl-5-hydroxy-6-metoxy-1,4-benzoquinol methylase